jgi:oxygen-independent coproporphyrinogen-3 oxidase
MSATALDRLLSDIRALLPTGALDCEITLEANPGTFEAERFAGLPRFGSESVVDRHPVVRRTKAEVARANPRSLTGIHRDRDAHAVTFDNFNLDLMYALPGQSLIELQADVEHALRAQPPHVSLYQLTLEPQYTVFAKYPPALPDEDVAAAMQEWIEARTAEAGYRRYEVSAYATPCANAGTTSITGLRRLPRRRCRRAQQDLVSASHRSSKCVFVSRRLI